MNPSAPADGQPSPTSLPGRDPVADADTTLIRKRQRTTPPQRDVDDLDSPGHATGSPLVIEVIALEQDLESPAEIIIMDDEIFDANDIASFPWATDHRGPEQAAAHFANICCDANTRNGFYGELTEFAGWIRDHVAASSNAHDQRTYVQNRTFWFHVGRCFEGLAIRRMNLPCWKEPSGPAFYHNFLVSFAKLFAMLCEVEADQLEHATSRRDSAKPASPTKHCLLFRPYITSFEAFMARSENASNTTEHDPFFAIQQRMALAFFRQQKETDSLFRTFSLVAARAEAVEFAQEALLSCLRISARVLATILSEEPAASQNGPASQNMALDHVDHIEELRASMVNMLELYTTRIMPNVMKTHPEYLPMSFHNAAVDTLGCVIDVLAPSYVPPGLFAAMERTMSYHITLEDLVAPRDNSPTADPVFTKQTLSVAFRLETYNLFIRSGMVTLRVIGLEMLGHFVFHLWRSLGQDPEKLSSDSKAQSIHPTLQFTAKFLLSNDFVRYLFGSDSHADLIRRSSKVVDFLAATNNLRSSDADVLWNTCLHNQLTDVGQASFQALASLFRTNSLPELMYFCKKYEDLSPSQLGKPMIAVFKELVTNIQIKKPSPEECFEVAAIGTRLLQRISSEWRDVDIQNFRCLATPNFIDLLELSGNSREYRLMILKLCAAEIKGRTSQATGSAHMLHDLVFSHSTDMDMSELTGVLTFKDITDELCQYVNSQKADGEASGTSGAFALFSRLRLANVLLAWMADTYEADIERTLWEHTIGVEAIDNEARILAWHALITDLKILPILSDYLERCIGSYLPTLPASHAVTDIIVAYRYAQEIAPVDRRFDLAFGNEIIRFALTIPEGDIADIFMQHAMEALFSRKALSVPDAAADQQVAVVERCIECIRLQTDHQPLRAVKLLRKLLQQSIAFQSTIAAPEAGPFAEFKHGNDEESMVRFSVDIYGTPGREARRSIIIGRQETLADLQSALVKAADFNDVLVICGGQPLDVSKQPLKKIGDSGIVGKALIVKKNNTLQTVEDDRSRRCGRSALERAILQNFSELYSRLDDADETSEQIFWLLTELQHSTTWHAIPLDGNPWKLLFSVHRLSVELREQLALGIADSSFILQGVHKMIHALEEPQLCSDRLVLRYMARTLFEFLRERPVHDLSNQYFIDASKFVHAALSNLCTVAQMAEDLERIDKVDISDPSQTALDLYRSLLEGVRISPVVCKAFIGAPNVASVHKKILFHGNQALSGGISHCIRSFCVDEDSLVTPAEAQSLFWTTILGFVPEAQNDPTTCASLYRMAPEILRTNATVVSSESELKNLVDSFSAILLQTHHQERFGTNLMDYRVPGLCSLLLVCVDKLKSFKKPLNLGHFAIQVFQLFLFPPPVHDLDSKCHTMPIVTGETRRSLYCLVYALCEDQSTLTALTNLTLQALRLSDIPSWLSFSGRESFSRADCGYSGLTNLQQTCYMNSLVQQLYMNLNFRKFILDTPVVNDTRQAVLQEFKRAFASMQDSYSLAYTPDNLARALDVDITVQDDAQIFFTILIGKLEDSMPNEEAKKSLRAFFGGSNRSQTVGECGHVSESPDSYYNLSLVVKDKSTLEESLQEYVQGAPLEGGDKFKCVTCDAKGGGVYVNATRRTGLEHVPDNLVLGLKRFRYETYDGGAKVNDRFDFPERIDMNPYKIQCLTNLEVSMDSDIFQLVGVVVHDGTLQYGHYWSYAAERSFAGPESMPWYRFEDRLANRVTVEDVISETRGGLGRPDRSGQAWTRSDNAYVLFYERLSSIKSSTMQESSSSGPMMGLHPTVAIPEDLRHEITTENEKHLRKLNVFALEHADFLRGLLMKFEDISKGQPTEDKAAELSLLELAFEHLFQVTTRTPALEHLDVIASSMRKLTSLSPDNAVHLITLMFHQSHPEICEHLIFHRRSAVRNHIRHLLVAALRSLREQDPRRYGIELDGRLSEHVDTNIGLVTRAHSDLLSRLHHTGTRTGWPEYFAFVTDIASFGQAEVNLLLDRGYLTWCLEILYIGHDKTLQAKHADMWYHMENNRVYPRHALSDCIYGLVHEHVDLTKVSEDVTDEYQASAAPDRTPLNREEVALFSRTDRKGRSALVASALDTVKDDEELVLRPARLVTLLTDESKTDKVLVKAACLALQHGLEDDGFPVYVEAISHCLSNVKIAPAYRNMLIEAVAKLPEHYEDIAETVLRFMKSVYAVAPVQVLGLVMTWLEKLLLCEDTESEDAALEWLRTLLFSYTPLTKPYDYETLTLDYHHSVTVRQLAGFLMQLCAHGRNRSSDFQDYERVVEALRRCVPWLERFDDMMRKQYSTDDQDSGAGSGDTQMDARVIARIEDLKEAAMDARGLWEPIQETFRWLNDWSEGEANGVTFTHRYRSLGASYSRTNDADTDADLAATEDEEDWDSDGGDEPELP